MGEPDEPAAAPGRDDGAPAAAGATASSTPAPAAERRARAAGLSPAAIFAALLGLGIPVLAIMVAYQSCTDTTVRGGVAVRGDGPGWQRTIDVCTADPFALAVTLAAGDTAVVHVLVDPLDGPRAELARPGGPALVLTDPSRPPAPGWVEVTGGVIGHVGAAPTGAAATETVDASGCLVIPAFVNTHCHTSQQLGRGLRINVVSPGLVLTPMSESSWVLLAMVWCSFLQAPAAAMDSVAAATAASVVMPNFAYSVL